MFLEISKEYIIQRADNSVTLRRLEGKELYSIEYALYGTRNLPVKIVNHEFNYSINLQYIQDFKKIRQDFTLII